MPITQEQVLTFLGGGLFVFILDQAIQHHRRERRVLGYSADNRILAEKSHADLKISFKGLDVTKVLSHHIRLKNIGNTCLKNFTVYIHGAGGTYYFAHTSAKPGIECKKVDPAPCFAFEVNLLNAGEEIQVELTILNPADAALVVEARGENLRTKNISEARVAGEMLDAALESTSGLTWTIARLVKVFLRQ